MCQNGCTNNCSCENTKEFTSNINYDGNAVPCLDINGDIKPPYTGLNELLDLMTTKLCELDERDEPFYIYEGLLSQTGTNAPTVIELYNTLGFTPTFDYDGVGSYIVNAFASDFVVNKTAPFLMATGNSIAQIASVNVDEIFLSSRDSSGTPTDGLLVNAYFQIKIKK